MQQLLELNNLLHSSPSTFSDVLPTVAQRLTDHTADWCLISQVRGETFAVEAIGHADTTQREQLQQYIKSRQPAPDVKWLQDWNDPLATSLTGLNKITTIPIQGQNGVLGYLSVGLTDPAAVLEPDAMLLLQNTASALAGRIERHTLKEQMSGLGNTIYSERGHLQTILQSVPVGIVIVDAKTRDTLLINHEMERLRGDSSYELHLADDSQAADPLTRALAGETTRNTELTVVRENGTRLPIMAGAVPLRDPTGAIEGAILIWQDIANLRDAQNTRELLLSAASHELRTPLTSLLGFIQLLETRPDAQADRRAKWLAYVGEKARFVAQLVEELINLSRAQSGWLRLESEKTDMRELTETALAEAHSADSQHEYSLTAPAEPITAFVDRHKVLEILQNLLINAATYSPPDTRIEVSLERDEQRFRIKVRDYGIGISSEDQQHIFLPFYRAEAAYKYTGTGLGLSIVNSFTNLHRGRIWVESTGNTGEGSLFILELPYS